MRKIQKGEPIQDFTNFLKTNPTDWDKDFHSISNIGLSAKCREHILVFEQDCQSGYTEMPLKLSSNHKDQQIHIDHYKKKNANLFPELTFDWNNFIVDSRDTNFGACHKDKLVKSREIYNDIFNPVTDNVERYISFQKDGKMIPKPDITEELKKRVEKTIELFALNHPTLKHKRKGAIVLIENLTTLPDNEIKECMKEYGFRSVIEYMLSERNI